MEEQKSILTVPVAIIIAGAIIAGAVLYSKTPGDTPQVAGVQESEGVMAPVTNEDHILGNPDAEIKIVEYSDTSCPFCKQFHPTMERIMDEYGKDGRVAWVYRHFPLNKPDSLGRMLHPNAGKEAEAMECAAELGGNQKFWEYASRLYNVTPAVTGATPEGLPLTELPNIAEYVGLDRAKFESCLASGRYADEVEEDYVDGLNAGVLGTPFSYIITKSGGKVPINGALPYADIKKAIDTLLAQSQ